VVNFETLWAPWRLGYIKGQEGQPAARRAEPKWLPGADRDCFLCRSVAEDCDRENLLVCRRGEVFVILNRFPYNNGHLLIAPRLHKGKLEELTAAEQLECQQELTRQVTLIQQTTNAEGFNIGLNLGRMAGAGVPGHLHWHIVPRSLWELLTTAIAQSKPTSAKH
jgi:ATP adenylyltransferase